MKNKGFTLIDLMIVIIIIGILAAIIIPQIVGKEKQLQTEIESVKEKSKNVKLSKDFKTETEEFKKQAEKYLQVTKQELKKLNEEVKTTKEEKSIKKKETSNKNTNEGIKYGLSKVNMTYEKANCIQINSLQIECTENNIHALCTKSYYGYDCKIK